MLSLESCPSTQSTWCKTTKKGIYLHLHLSRSAPTSWTANYLDRKTLNWTWQSVTSLNQPSLMDSSAIHLTLQSLEDHQLEKVEQVPCSSSTLLYHVSLWYLGAETGYRVVTPYRRRERNVRKGGCSKKWASPPFWYFGPPLEKKGLFWGGKKAWNIPLWI